MDGSHRARSTSDQLPTYSPRTLPGMDEFISLPESAAGSPPLHSPAGLLIDPSGPARVLANRSRSRGKRKAKATPGTSGPKCSDYLRRSALNASLANKCRELLSTGGSTEFVQTWKERDIPSAGSYWEHTARALLKSGSESTGWPTAQARDGSNRGAMEARANGERMNLDDYAQTAAWPTPAAQNADGGPSPTADPGNYYTLQTAIQTAGWPTPQVCQAPNMSENRGEEYGGKRQRITPQTVEAIMAQTATVIHWQTPSASDGMGGHLTRGHGRQDELLLGGEAKSLMSWSTPRAEEKLQHNSADNGMALSAQVLSSWNTPRATDGPNGGPNQSGGALPADAAQAMAWATPTTQDGSNNAGPSQWGRNSLPLNCEAATVQTLQPAWVPCPCDCGNYWCTIHQTHAHDCECPPIEEWETDPYTTPGPIPPGGPAEIQSADWSGAGFRLNPAFSLWLMGFGIEWALCAARVTRSSRKSRRSLFGRSSNSKQKKVNSE